MRIGEQKAFRANQSTESSTTVKKRQPVQPHRQPQAPQEFSSSKRELRDLDSDPSGRVKEFEVLRKLS
jgi:hypothetical protein